MITEILVTVVVITIVMLAVIPMFSAGVKTGRVSKQRVINSNIAQKEIERINQEGFDRIIEHITNTTNIIKDKNDSLLTLGSPSSGIRATFSLYDPNITTPYDISYPEHNDGWTEIVTRYVNRENGQLSESPSAGFAPVNIIRVYTFLEGMMQVINSKNIDVTKQDDVIQVSVKVSVNGSTARNIVAMTTMIHRTPQSIN